MFDHSLAEVSSWTMSFTACSTPSDRFIPPFTVCRMATNNGGFSACRLSLSTYHPISTYRSLFSSPRLLFVCSLVSSSWLPEKEKFQKSISLCIMAAFIGLSTSILLCFSLSLSSAKPETVAMIPYVPKHAADMCIRSCKCWVSKNEHRLELRTRPGAIFGTSRDRLVSQSIISICMTCTLLLHLLCLLNRCPPDTESYISAIGFESTLLNHPTPIPSQIGRLEIFHPALT